MLRARVWTVVLWCGAMGLGCGARGEPEVVDAERPTPPPTQAQIEMCTNEGVACDQVFAQWNLRPPRSTSDVPGTAAAELRITPTVMQLDGVELLPLVEGRSASDAFVGHVSPRLLAALETYAATDDSEHPLRILADRNTPFATIADTLFTASRANIDLIALAVANDQGVSTIAIALPLAWKPDSLERERPLAFDFTLFADRVDFAVERRPIGTFRRSVCGPAASESCYEFLTLAAVITKLKDAYPHETVASLHVRGDVPLQTVVTLLDEVRGKNCRLAAAVAGGMVPDDCLLWQAILDAEPGWDHEGNEKLERE